MSWRPSASGRHRGPVLVRERATAERAGGRPLELVAAQVGDAVQSSLGCSPDDLAADRLVALALELGELVGRRLSAQPTLCGCLSAASLGRAGLGSLSGGVAGFRHNMRILARHLAQTYFGVDVPRRELRPDEVVPFLLAEANGAPELWNQRAYLARVVSVQPDARVFDEGVLPLQYFLDSSGPDAVAITVETDDHGEHRPAAYVRQRGAINEVVLPGDPLLNFDGQDHHTRLAEVVRPLLPPASL